MSRKSLFISLFLFFMLLVLAALRPDDSSADGPWPTDFITNQARIGRPWIVEEPGEPEEPVEPGNRDLDNPPHCAYGLDLNHGNLPDGYGLPERRGSCAFPDGMWGHLLRNILFLLSI